MNRSRRERTGRGARWLAVPLLAILLFLLWPARFGGATTLVVVRGSSMAPKYHTGDLVVARAQDRYAAGDIVVFPISDGAGGAQMVIHRLLAIAPDGTITTQGDNRAQPDGFALRTSDIAGTAVFNIGLGGRVLVIVSTWWFLALAAGLAAMRRLWPTEAAATAPAGGSVAADADAAPARRRRRRARVTEASDPRRRGSASSLSSQRGSHQFLSPSSSIVAGTRSMRTMVASKRIAVARPVPIIFIVRSNSSMNDPKTTTMIAAAAVITLRGRRETVGDRGPAVAGAAPLLTDPGEEEHLVVHREAEHDREQHHRDPRVDRPRCHARDVAQPAPLEQRDHHAVRGADREQVHEHGLQRHEQRPEHEHQQQERQRRARRRRRSASVRPCTPTCRRSRPRGR